MDERLSQALEFSNYITTINNQKRMIKEKYFQSLIYFCQGGQFTITKELITFVTLLVEKGNVENIVLVDDNDTPIQINDLEMFLDEILSKYFETANTYHQKYTELAKNRDIGSLVNND
jgi:hypothetical protein